MTTLRLIHGDALEEMRKLEAGSVQACVTSPPYWGLRDYGVAGQLGLEPTPEEYVARMVEVFREVRRVLRDDGTLWLNLGDSYAQNEVRHKQGGPNSSLRYGAGCDKATETYAIETTQTGRKLDHGLKPKDLIGIPWRVAFALQADGWVLRSEIIWAKPSPMPESVRDRPTKAHEQVFLFCKAAWTGPEPGRFGRIADDDARWIAGLVDCEGSIVVKRVKHDGRGDTFAPQVSIGSTCRELLERVVEIVGHGNILERPGQNAPMWYWQVGNNVARDFLHRIYPFLIIKPRQARIGIHLDSLTYARGGQTPERKQRTQTETDRLISLWERNKSLNHFGDPDLSDVPEPGYGRWSKSARYFWDAEAVAEAVQTSTVERSAYAGSTAHPRGWHTGAVPISGGAKDAAGKVAGDCSPVRNIRTVWTIATEPFNGARLMRDVSYGSGRITSPDCPVHGDSAIQESTDQRGERRGASSSDRSPYTGDHLSQEQRAEPSPIQTLPSGHCAPGSSDCSVLACGSPATPHSNGSSKTGRAQLTSQHGTDDEGCFSHTGDRQQRCEQSATSVRTCESRSVADSDEDEMVPGQVGRTGNGSVRKCTCKQNNTPTDHFATMPTALAERCIRAGSRIGDVVLDPFAGSGTVGQVARGLNRSVVLIELNAAYLPLIERRCALPWERTPRANDEQPGLFAPDLTTP